MSKAAERRAEGSTDADSPHVAEGPEPYHDSSSLPTGERKGRLLLISWHFPPSQAAGALRWQKFSRFAAERGWELDVIALDPAELSNPDPRRLEELPRGVRVFGVPPRRPLLDRMEHGAWRAWRRLRDLRNGRGESAGAAGAEPGADRDGADDRDGTGAERPHSFAREDVTWSLGRPRGWARAWWAWRQHAADEAWARAAAALGEHLAELARYRAVITCGPPHMVHEAGRLLTERLGVPFVMDLRDPWSLQQRLLEPVASPLWYRLARRLERRCVERAALVVANTEPAAEAMRVAYPDAADRVIAVMNGFDEEPLPASPENGPFLIAYLGTIYLDRDPGPLFRAAARTVRELDLGPEDFRIELVGKVACYDGVPIDRMAEREGIGAHVSIGPFLPRPQALALMARATVLVSLPQDSDLAIPSKVFEYMRFPAWVLAMARPDSATGRVLRDTGADLVTPGDVEALSDVLRRRYVEYRASGRPTPIAETTGKQLGRERQAKRLLETLEERCSWRTF